MIKKTRARRSPIWKMGLEDFTKLVKSKDTLSDILREFGLRPIGGNGKTLKDRLLYHGIDFSHIVLGAGSKKKKHYGGKRPTPDELLFCENSDISRHSVKNQIMKRGLILNECAICEQPPVWMNKRLVLILDHANGIHNDNRLQNLRLLCPNCNSQLDTHCAKNSTRTGGANLTIGQNAQY